MRDALAERRVLVDGEIETDGLREIGRFTRIELDGKILQGEEVLYLMLHKPAGYLSATEDREHPTVMELIDEALRKDLHLAGRLDRASTGLLLLTNDGNWSKRITEPVEEIAKVYRVTTLDDISPNTAEAFARGMYFAYEDHTTRPASLEIVAPREAIVTIHEGRYHQVKRMFHAVGNRVMSLHRERIGPLALGDLAVGKCRRLSLEEVGIFPTSGG